jgi:hypothetical protein
VPSGGSRLASILVSLGHTFHMPVDKLLFQHRFFSNRNFFRFVDSDWPFLSRRRTLSGIALLHSNSVHMFIFPLRAS